MFRHRASCSLRARAAYSSWMLSLRLMKEKERVTHITLKKIFRHPQNMLNYLINKKKIWKSDKSDDLYNIEEI